MLNYLFYVKKKTMGLEGIKVCLYICGVKRAIIKSCEKTLPAI